MSVNNSLVLVALNGKREFSIKYSPLAVELLTGYLKNVKPEIQIHACYTSLSSLDEITSDIKKNPPKVIGISASVDSQIELLTLLDKIKELDLEETKTILGGIVPSVAFEGLLQKYPDIYIVTGEGEIALHRFMEWIDNQAAMADVPNLVFMENGILQRTTSREVITMEKVHYQPDLEITKKMLEKYGSDGLEYYIETGRGCIGSCIFCAMRVAYNGNTSPRRYPLATVLENIKRAYDAGVRLFQFADPEFINNDFDWVLRFADELIKTGYEFELEIDARLDSLYNKKDSAEIAAKKMNMWNLLKKAGLKKVFVGMESLSNSMLKRFRKNITATDALKGFEVLDKLEMDFIAGFMPWDFDTTAEDMNENVDNLLSEEFNKFNLLSHIRSVLRGVEPRLGTPYAKSLRDEGFGVEKSIDFEISDTADNAIKTAAQRMNNNTFPDDIEKTLKSSSTIMKLSQSNRNPVIAHAIDLIMYDYIPFVDPIYWSRWNIKYIKDKDISKILDDLLIVKLNRLGLIFTKLLFNAPKKDHYVMFDQHKSEVLALLHEFLELIPSLSLSARDRKIVDKLTSMSKDFIAKEEKINKAEFHRRIASLSGMNQTYGQIIGNLEVSIVDGDMTRLDHIADAWVIPHFYNAVSYGGVSAEVIRAGGESGIEEYAEYIKTHDIPFGDVTVTKSGNARTKYFLHVVSANTSEVEALTVLRKAVINLFDSAERERINSIALPALGTGIIGTLSFSQSAGTIISTLQELSKRETCIKQIIVVIYKNIHGYDDFVIALKNMEDVKSFNKGRFITELDKDKEISVAHRMTLKEAKVMANRAFSEFLNERQIPTSMKEFRIKIKEKKTLDMYSDILVKNSLLSYFKKRYNGLYKPEIESGIMKAGLELLSNYLNIISNEKHN